jgi:hypothetical protein
MGLLRKMAALRSLRPDIAMLSEVASPERLRKDLPDGRHANRLGR